VKLTPRYDGPPLVRFPMPAGDLSVPMLRQRRRLAEILTTLDDGQWAAPSRCEAWTVRDVVSHLVGVDQFWHLTIGAGLAGASTRFLQKDFDPVVTPAQLVDGARDVAAPAVLEQFVAGVEQLAQDLTGLDDEQWQLLAESPPGHVPLHALVRHALWDAWIHERDVVLPLGMAPVEEPDEVAVSLEYAAALGPAFLAMGGSTRAATLVVDGTDPTTHVVIELGPTVVVHDGEASPGAVRISGRSAELVEALSFRTPFSFDVADDDRWLFDGLATVFDLVDT
jgi:uncharacterized protein (TIGR03083 family)